MNFDKTLQKYKEVIDSGLINLFEEIINESKDFIQSSYFSLREFVLKGGKKLRPITTIMAFKALCNQDEKKIYLPAVGLELFHNSSERFGTSIAILHGDILYALTVCCFTNSQFETEEISRALDVIGQTYRVISEGQMLDILSEQKRDLTETDYLEVIEK